MLEKNTDSEVHVEKIETRATGSIAFGLERIGLIAVRAPILSCIILVGLIIGAAFGRIVSSLVADILMPPIGLVLAKADFSSLFIPLVPSAQALKSVAEAKAAGVPTINYGLFINAIVDFIIVAFVMFLVVRQINKMKRAPSPTTQPCPSACRRSRSGHRVAPTAPRNCPRRRKAVDNSLKSVKQRRISP